MFEPFFTGFASMLSFIILSALVNSVILRALFISFKMKSTYQKTLLVASLHSLISIGLATLIFSYGTLIPFSSSASMLSVLLNNIVLLIATLPTLIIIRTIYHAPWKSSLLTWIALIVLLGFEYGVFSAILWLAYIFRGGNIF